MIYDYTLKTGKGEELNLADYKGKVVMVMDKGVSFFGSAREYAEQYDARGRKRDA